MFKISTKGDYGLLLMASLAEKGRENFVALKTIAEEKNISLSYLSQIVIPLKEAKLVESKEGAAGGYRLAKNPSEISLFEILKILEGECAPVRCTRNESCQCETQCGVKYAWQDAVSILEDFLKSKTLSDVMKKYSSPISTPVSSPIEFMKYS